MFIFKDIQEGLRNSCNLCYHLRCGEEISGHELEELWQAVQNTTINFLPGLVKIEFSVIVRFDSLPLKPESSHAAAQMLTQTGVCFSYNREHCNAAECRHLHLCSISVRGCTRNGAAQNTIIFEPKKLLLTTMQPTKIKKIKLANSPIKIRFYKNFL